MQNQAVWSFIQVFLQVTVLVICLFAPGNWLLGLVFRRIGSPSLPRSIRLGMELSVSAILVAGLAALSLVFGRTYFLVCAWSVLGLSAAYLLGKALRSDFNKTLSALPLEKKVVLILVGIVACCAFFSFPLSSYPGPFSVGYGDLPSYYRISSNLAHLRFPLADFKAGDYPGEIYDLPVRYPFLILLTSFFMQIFPSTDCLLGFFCSLCGLVTLMAGVSIVERSLPKPVSRWIGVAATLGLLATQYFIAHVIFGAIGLPTTLFTMLGIFLLFFSENISRWNRLRLSLPLFGAAALSRPEAVLFTGLLFFCVALVHLLGTAKGGKSRKARVSAALGIAFLLSSAASVAVIVPATRDFSISFHEYDSKSGRFRSRYLKWYHANFSFALKTVRPDIDEGVNPNVKKEIIGHPLSFAKWVFINNALQLGIERGIEAFLSILVLLFLWRGSPLIALPISAILFFPVLGCINVNFAGRHVLHVLFPLLVFAIMALVRVAGAKPRVSRHIPAVVAILIPLSLFRCIDLTHFSFGVRVDPVSIGMSYPLDVLKSRVKSGDVVLSTYPQLISFVLDTPSVGNAIIAVMLPELIKKYDPRYIVVEEHRGIFDNYEYFKKRFGMSGIPGYRPIDDNPLFKYLILEKDNPGRAS